MSTHSGAALRRPVALARRWAGSFRGPMTLRRRLILSIVALAVGLSVLIGFLSVVTLQGLLKNQLDAQLNAATSRAQHGIPQTYDPSGQSSGLQELLSGTAQGPGTLAVLFSGTRAYTQGRINDDGVVENPLTAASFQKLSLIKPSSDPVTVDLGGNTGVYRVKSVSTTGGDVLVIGLPMATFNATIARLILTIVIVTVIGLVVAIALALLVVRYALRPLQRMAETAGRVAEMPLARGEVALDTRVPEEDTDVRTEVGRVGFAMNRMLGHVSNALVARQESENKVRQFVADASHELRTPLASVRGYAELTRRMGKDLPEDVVYAMGRIESESVRMTSLVEELLLLARLDEGTDLVKKNVDLTRIILDAVHDTGVANTSHQYDVTVPEEPITLLGDPMRLHQVVANLLNNARTHTPEGTEVWVTLERDDVAHEAVVTVADNGPGIDPGVMPVLFERFARADSSRSRKAGSTGLGLAIVQAVVQSHGGTVVASNGEPGAVFTVRLPLEAVPSGAPVPLPAPAVARS